MKILIVSDWYNPQINGVVTSINALENKLREKGHEVRILTLNDIKHSEIHGNIYRLGSLSADGIYDNARFSLSQNKKIYQSILEWSPDVIHTQTEFSTFLWARKIRDVLNIPLVHTYHTDYSQYVHYFAPRKMIRSDIAGKSLIKRFIKLVVRYTDAVIVPTEKTLTQLEKNKIKKPIHVIGTGIDVSFFSGDKSVDLRRHYGISDDEIVLLSVCRLGAEKNVDETIKLFNKLVNDKDNNTTYRLLIIGDGPEKENLLKLTEKLQIVDSVIFTGMISRENISSYYHMGDIFVSSSTTETQGLTYIEALASGLPLLCKKDSVLNNVLLNNVTGVFFNNEESFIKAIRHIEDNNIAMSYSSLLHAQNFSQDKFVDEVLKVYKLLLNYSRN